MQNILITDITIGQRKRVADPHKVATLAESIHEIGALMNPITVSPRNALIAGLHRLQACKALGWTHIPAIILDIDPLKTELAEIDENLIRNDLSELMQGVWLARRKEIYEELHPQTKQGGDRGNQHTGGKPREANGNNFHLPASFAADTADKTGQTERTIRNKVQIGKQLADVAEQLQGSAIEDSQRDLLALARLSPSERRAVVDTIAAGSEDDTVENWRALTDRTTEPLPFTPATDDAQRATPEEDTSALPERPTVLFSNDSVEWYTPARYIEAARRVMGGFDTDPASNETAQRTIQAATHYTIDNDGFDQPWHGRVWLNPPYGVVGGKAVAGKWAERLIAQYDQGITTEAVLLVNAVIDSRWFDILWRFPMCLTNHRIRFEVPAGTPKELPNSPVIGSAIVYLGRNVAAFVREFSIFGAVVARLHTDGDQVLTEMEISDATSYRQ